jgi:hypothetical protein
MLSTCLYPPVSTLIAWTNLYETWYLYHDTWTHLSSVLHKSLPSVYVCACVYPIVATQRLSKNVIAVTHTRATLEELLDVPFSMRPVSYQRTVRDYFFLELLVSMCISIPWKHDCKNVSRWECQHRHCVTINIIKDVTFKTMPLICFLDQAHKTNVWAYWRYCLRPRLSHSKVKNRF